MITNDSLVSSSNWISIRFRSNDDVTFRGFKGTFRSKFATNLKPPANLQTLWYYAGKKIGYFQEQIKLTFKGWL